MLQKILLLALLSAFLTSCGPYKEMVATSNRGRLSDLKLGISQGQTLEVMGKPWKTESYLEGSSTFVILYYVTQVIPDNATTEDEMTPIVLKDGKLVGWGRKFFSDLRIQISSDKPQS